MRLPRTPIRAFAGRYPRTAVAAADFIGWSSARLGLGLSDHDVRRFFPDLSDVEIGRIRRAAWRRWVRLRVLDAASAWPGADWPYPPLAHEAVLPTIEAPAILASFHVGPIPATGMLLEQLPESTVVLHVGQSARPSLEVVAVGADDWSRAAALRAGVDALRDGKYVFLMVDANVFPATLEVEMFGRTTRLARGAFALSRMTGVPIVPFAARWRGRRIELVTGTPIQPGSESETAAATAAWFEQFVRDAPEEIGTQFVTSFWGEPA